MSIQTTTQDVYAFLNRTRQSLSGVQDSALVQALETAERLVAIEKDSKNKLRESDLAASQSREGVSGPASSVLVMAYLAVKYPELAKNISPSSVKRDLATQLDQMTGATAAGFGKPTTHELPEKVLAHLRRFVTPGRTTGTSVSELLGPMLWGGKVRADAGVVGIESDRAFLVFDVKKGEATLAKKTVAGVETPEVVDLSALSPKALEELLAQIGAAQLVPPKPEGALAARSWEAQHGPTKKAIDTVQATLTQELAARRRELQAKGRMTTDDFAIALDEYFGATRGLQGVGQKLIILDMCHGKDNVDALGLGRLFEDVYRLHAGTGR
jgi:hypothetical protein